MLEELDLSRNALRQVPSSLAALGQLSKLDLSGNRLKWFPSNLCRLTSLRSLNVSDNAIKEVPASISALVDLEELDLGFNNLERLPKELFALPRLRKLELSGNQLKRSWILLATRASTSSARADTLPASTATARRRSERTGPRRFRGQSHYPRARSRRSSIRTRSGSCRRSVSADVSGCRSCRYSL
ncbi:leucine-rich repeat domain-containing protein [Sorangium sp. So ce385]|uniref:leucine-rich repeat domain-containing protein n=1 Tax=Sorangium sp. So ce385 TaxID=3133308 RepID=UPI003F5C4A73